MNYETKCILLAPVLWIAAMLAYWGVWWVMREGVGLAVAAVCHCLIRLGGG